MHIRDLIAKTGIPERQVRYLIAEGFVPAPRGGRANADYGDDHVLAVRRYSRLHELGFPPAAIRLLLQSMEGVPFPLGPGVTLVLDPGLLGSGIDPAPLLARAADLLPDLLKDPTNASQPNADPD